MRTFALALLAMLGIGVWNSASAQTGDKPASPPTQDPIRAENLITPLPSGWKVAHNASNDKGFTIQEFIPASQTLDSWTEMVTVLIYRGAGGTPIGKFFDFQEKVYRDGCDSPPTIGKRQEIVENGYSGGAQLLACPRTKKWGRAEVMIYKTLNGKDAAYQVQRAWRLPASDAPGTSGIPGMTKEMLEAGSAYLKQVYVCDTREAARPCPKVKG